MFTSICFDRVGRTSSVYTIDVHHSTPSNFTNPGYVATEGGVKSQSNDGLPSYEEAISGVKSPIVSATPTAVPTVDVVNEETINASSSSSSRGRRHRHRHRRHHHQNSEQQNENDQPDAPEDHRRNRHRRGFRLKRHLAKINRRNNPETD